LKMNKSLPPSLASEETEIIQSSNVAATIGTDVKFQCQYDNLKGNYDSVYWYLQRANQRLTYIYHTFQGTMELERYQLSVDRKLSSSTLTIKHVQPRDRAIYYCGVNTAGAGRLTFGKGTQLIIQPSIKDPDPTVYQLRDSKFRNTSVCLFTDFESPINETQGTKDSEVFISKNPVLDMRSMDSKSNGALAWSNKIDFTCRSAFTENASFPSPGEYLPLTLAHCISLLLQRHGSA
uniref:Ig-like domain-containing protein n=1 Tax=Sciurus vulgaris TaxID=55149 RepID=A0A8D2ATJ5_SCIVU